MKILRACFQPTDTVCQQGCIFFFLVEVEGDKLEGSGGLNTAEIVIQDKGPLSFLYSSLDKFKHNKDSGVTSSASCNGAWRLRMVIVIVN